MPSTAQGAPCGVMESCPDGSNYHVLCDGSTGSCMCFANAAQTAAMPTISCTAFDPMATLVACGFPPGRI